MKLLIYSFLIWIGAVPLMMLLHKRASLVRGIGALSIIAGSAFGIISGFRTVILNLNENLIFDWSIPWSKFHIGIDPLSGWFLIPICLLAFLASIYGFAYDKHEESYFSANFSWSMFIVLLLSMVMVVLARDGVLFFMAWEVMALGSFFLVIREHNQNASQKAAFIYLVATHIGTIFILILFLLEATTTGSFDFNKWAQNSGNVTGASALFMLAVIGFGTKAGFIPLHIWLPEAHPAAPSYISALMSGVMIKTGIYGILRSLGWFGEPHAWWGYLMIGIGLASGILGVLFALAQRDLKRLLAYSSVENIGIIALGIGIAILGISFDKPGLAFLGFAGALLHVVNHAVFKGLLFLGAGSVLHAVKDRNMENMGGLIKKMPATGIAFLVASAAIAGLPVLNGFVSEFTIFFGGLSGIMSEKPALIISSIFVVAGLGLIGGIAAACFARAFGIVFLGEPRSDKSAYAIESDTLMILPMLALSGLCFVIGLNGACMISFVLSPITNIYSKAPDGFILIQAIIQNSLNFVSIIGLLAVLVTIVLYLIRNYLLKQTPPAADVTWDCGYIKPSAKMQYTASSFAQPFVHLFKPILRTKANFQMPKQYFPHRASFHSETPDIFHLDFYAPLSRKIYDHLSRFKFLQHGYIQIYILYIALTLLVLLIWKLG
ncbi:MAG: proton-conducting transporter membrane subunit [Verrucomicrobiae bacterium]|nr:proton-conducting transporter membrane subunit [Verrucomicrobiae bacterium]